MHLKTRGLLGWRKQRGVFRMGSRQRVDADDKLSSCRGKGCVAGRGNEDGEGGGRRRCCTVGLDALSGEERTAWGETCHPAHFVRGIFPEGGGDLCVTHPLGLGFLPPLLTLLSVSLEGEER